ncbi:MAG: lipopolysaccharide A protein [Paramuribaculum sp.]|nr:lipopolysaccharide A protein [Paramuribaculum sp.]
MSLYRKISKAWKRLRYYGGNFARYFLPSGWWRIMYQRKIKRLTPDELARMEKRVKYYINLPEGASYNPKTAVEVGNFHFPYKAKKKFSGYFFDLFELVRCGNRNNKFNYLFGDIREETDCACFVKSRPVSAGTSLSVITRLDGLRHFAFISDTRDYKSKKDMLVFRNVVQHQPWRTAFLRLYHNHPMVDAGQVNHDMAENPAHIKPRLSIEEQLEYKFICCIEGHDVATNLKWVMSSNSIAVMPRPRIESWYMEGTLKGDYHYIEVKPDYSDVIDKIQYYIDHPEEAEAIISHAHEYVNQFRDTRRELLIGRMVAMRYFQLTN